MLWPQNRNHRERRKPRTILTNACCRVLAGWILLSPAHAQSTAPAQAVPGGQGEIALQGYYLGGNQQDVWNTTGTAFRFQEFLPTIGLISGSVEAYGSQNRFQTGENFLEWKGLAWAGHYWTFTGGDFHLLPNMMELPFNNIYTPEIDARGVKIQAVHGDTQYAFFAGEETLTSGQRVVYRMPIPQMAMGAMVRRKLAPHLLVGARFLQFSSSRQAILDNPSLFPEGRSVAMARTATVQSLYTPLKRLKIYAEASRPFSTGVPKSLTSVLAAVTWEGAVFTLKANYVYQGVFYFPLAGYFSGDRQGPYGEAHFRPWKRVDLYGSASRYRNNLENNDSLPTMTSDSVASGVSVLLPAKVSAYGQLSTVRFRDDTPGQDSLLSNNRQISAGLSRGIGRHSLQLSWREIRTDMNGGLQRQRSTEAADTLQFRHFSVGGALRYQQMGGAERLNSLFVRGLAQVNLGPFSAHANVEIGNDFANQTVFATEAYRTSIVGAALRLPGRWNLQAEMFRNQLNFALNEQNIFLLENGALDGLSPAAANLAGFNQWSFYFRLSKQLHWGGGLPPENPAGLAAGSMRSLTGSIEGVVRTKTLEGTGLAASIPVSLEDGRKTASGPDGHYVFDNVPEGAHTVGLALAELPADFDPGDRQSSQIVVQPRRTARADFEVLPLSAVAGRIVGPDGVPLEGIVIRMAPGARYTSTSKDGSFTFYNLREGDYRLAVDAKTLPEGATLTPPDSTPIAVRAGAAMQAVEFRFVVVNTQKPIRKVLDRK